MSSKNIKVKNIQFQVIFRPEPEGGFTVLVPVLPGCITYGKNLNEARKMACEAISLYLEEMLFEGEALPRNDNSYISNLEVALPLTSRFKSHSPVHV